MQITELILKNFGKFTDKEIQLTDGINLIYGENESGKSTVHTFLRGMLFGMERGRGRAAQNDVFRKYEPWENPNFYAGVLRFTCGSRRFRLERHFDKYSKRTELFCEDDGEQLSPEHGDLEMLLGGMQETEYENTVSVGQMRAVTGASLAAELKNYAANYYAAGNSEINLDGALGALKERKKELEKEVRISGRIKQEKRDKISLEASYVWRELHRLEKEIERTEEEMKTQREEWQKCEEKRQQELHQEEQAGKFYGWRIHPVEMFGMIAAFVLSFLLFARPWNFLVAVVVALAEGLHIWNCLKDGKKKKDAQRRDAEKRMEEIGQVLEKQKWKLEKLREDEKEKRVQYGNLQEQLEELDEVSEESREQEKRRQALELAAQTMATLSRELQNGVSRKLDGRMSEILRGITGGKYEQVWVDEELHINLFANGRRIAMEQVSRGTIEQIYFALRMAAAEVLHEEEYPVILDDTFAYYDDARMEMTLRWLAENRKQVLIFTCQKREREALERMRLQYRFIGL